MVKVLSLSERMADNKRKYPYVLSLSFSDHANTYTLEKKHPGISKRRKKKEGKYFMLATHTLERKKADRHQQHTHVL
jgi:hypothetical protein